jgi:hypothetical protein
MLDDDAKRQFAREGYLRLEGALADLGTEAREAVAEAVPDDLDAPEELYGVGSRQPTVPTDEPFTSINDALYAYGRALVGDALREPSGPDMQLALRYPKRVRLGDAFDRTPAFGHLDGYGPGFRDTGDYNGFDVGAVVYLDDVPDRGGGFTVWPGSHLVAADYFRDHSLASPGYHGRLPAVAEDGWDYTAWFHEQARSRELAGPAGTVVLWHGRMVHSAGVNQSDRVRMAGIQRFAREGFDARKAEFAADPFAGWTGLDGIETPEV